MLEQNNWRGLPYFDAIGRKSHLTYREMQVVLAHPSTIFFLAATVMILVLFDAHGYQNLMPILSNVILWFICVLTLTGFYVGFTSICIMASRKFSAFFLYFPVIGLTSMTLNTFLTQKVASVLIGEAFLYSQGVEHLPVNLAIGLVFETLFLRFVVPQLIGGAVGEQSHESTATRQITIANKNFRFDQLLHVSSQDHYVQVVTVNSTQLVRARLSDVASQIPKSVGIMPHRSHWVARKAVRNLTGKSGARVLELVDGTKIPIARSKASSVQKWFEQ